ncbi:hypothetical protein T439DRAFT_379444 [Meredithblackwellia eburnea MCA 4105]
MANDLIIPLSVLDRVGADHSTLTLGYVLDPQHAHNAAERVDKAARAVASEWRLLAATVLKEKTKSGGNWSLSIPIQSTLPATYPTHSFTSSTIKQTLNPPRLSEKNAGVLDRPPLSLFRPANSSASMAEFAKAGAPILRVHVTEMNDAIWVGVTLPHGVFDATGMGMVIKALDAELKGEAWESPPLPRGEADLMDAVAEATSGAQVQQQQKKEYSVLYRDYVKPTFQAWVWILLTLVLEFFWHRNTTKQIFLSHRVVANIVNPIKEEVKSQSNGAEWVSTGDALLSWTLSSAYRGSRSRSRIAVTSVFSARNILPKLPIYPFNVPVTFSLPFFIIPELHPSPAPIAILHRRTLDSARNPSFFRSYLEHLESLNPTVRRAWDDRSWIFTNQVIAGMPELRAFGPLKAFWIFEAPFLIDHVVMINKVDEGYLLLCVLRQKEWDTLREVVDEL